jgi:hypothetical protein
MLIWQNVPRKKTEFEGGGDCVDTKCLVGGICGKMRVNGGSKEKVTI